MSSLPLSESRVVVGVSHRRHWALAGDALVAAPTSSTRNAKRPIMAQVYRTRG